MSGPIANCKCLMLFLGMITILTGCFEPKRDCLNVEALNYSIDADAPCAFCCEFPNLTIDFQHRIITADTTLNLNYLDEVYTVDSVNFFRFENIQFYLSDIQLIDSSGVAHPTIDTIQVEVPDGSGGVDEVFIRDNFALVNRSTLSAYTLGTFRRSGVYTGVRFNIGLYDTANQADPELFSEDHPLADDNDMYWSQDSGYVFNRIAFFRDTLAADTIASQIEIGLGEQLKTMELSFPAEFNLNPGFNPEIIFQINYLKWFEGVDVKNDELITISEKIVENLTDSFSVIVVQQDSN